jgi:hypothetical protein
MTNSEFSNEFDILYNNIMNDQAPGLNEYEKSVFLTKAQEEILIELYTGRGSLQTSFEESEELRRYLSPLVKEKTLTSYTSGSSVYDTSTVYNVDDDILFIIYEKAKVGNKRVKVYPVKHDELDKIINNPFRGPSNSRVLRLNYDNKIELVSKSRDITEYIIRYIKRPRPIILDGVSNTELTLDKVNTSSEPEIDALLHRKIVERAVLIALQSLNMTSKK